MMNAISIIRQPKEYPLFDRAEKMPEASPVGLEDSKKKSAQEGQENHLYSFGFIESALLEFGVIDTD